MDADRAVGRETADARWKGLFRTGGIAALLVVVMWSVEIVGVIAMGTPPTTVLDWFELYQRYGALGLFDTFLLDVIAAIFSVLVFLALYIVLRKDGEAPMAIATVLAVMGTTLMLALNATLSMYYLSRQYTAAPTDAQRAQIVASGQALLDAAQNSTGASLTFILGAIAGLMVSVVMLRGSTFTKTTAWAGITANAIQLVELPTAFAPDHFYEGMGPGVILMLASFVFYVIWYVLISVRLLRLSRRADEASP